jgi:tetratricopeptide (TPR) repeat protein
MLRHGQYEAAIEYLEKALQIEATPVIYSNIGTAYFLARRFKIAAVMFEKAVAQAPDSVVLRGNLAEAFHWGGDSRNAREEFDRAIALGAAQIAKNDSDPDATARLSMFYARRGRFEEANQMLSRIPLTNNPSVDYKRAVVRLIGGQVAQALKDLESALERGYPPVLAIADPNWDGVRNDRRFIALRDRYEKGWRIPRAQPASNGPTAAAPPNR